MIVTEDFEMPISSLAMGRLERLRTLPAVNTGPWPRAGLGLVTSHGPQIAVLAFSVYFLTAIAVEDGYVLLTEDHLFEYLTAAFYLASGLVCLIGFVTFRGATPCTRFWLVGWSVLFLLVALEEISWGQRFFGIDTPDFLASRNLQKETNFHNLDSEVVNRSFAACASAVGVVLPALVLLSKRAESPDRRFGVPLPPRDLMIPFALAFAFVVPAWAASAPETEVLTGLAFLWVCFIMFRKWRRSEAEITRLNFSHLRAGLVGIVGIQVVLSVFEGNLGHRSHASEIKEFLFSVCFLAFALRVALPNSGSRMARL